MKALMRHPYTGQVKIVKCGYSYTALFWGFLTPLFRGDFITALILFVLNVSGVMFSYGTLALIINTVFGFYYNRYFIKRLLKHGYEPMSSADAILIDRYLNS